MRAEELPLLAWLGNGGRAAIGMNIFSSTKAALVGLNSALASVTLPR